MILDNWSNFNKYLAMHPAFEAVDKFFKENDMAKLPLGRTDILPNGAAYVNVQDAPLHAMEDEKTEFHRAYIDIQITLDSKESMGWMPLPASAAAVDFNTEKDCGFLPGHPEVRFFVPGGYFVIFLPTDAHAPCCGKPGDTVRKLVVKVRV